MTRDERLGRQGWQRRGIYDEPRLSEVTALYKDIGMAVLVVPVLIEELRGCSECMKADCSRYQVVYTRKE